MTKYRALCVALLLVLFAGSAQASSCVVREYTTIGIATGLQVQVAGEPGTDQTPITVTGSAASSSAFASSTAFIRLICDVQSAFAFGTAPSATVNNSFVAVATPEYFAVPINQSFKISVIARP